MPYKDPQKRHDNNLKYRRENREYVNELNRNYYYSHKDTVNRRRRELYIEHRDYVSLYRKQLRKLDTEKFRSYERQYQKMHPEYGRETSRKRRAIELNASGNGITRKQETQLFEEYNYRCIYCGRKTSLTIDHVIPLNRGGEHDISNAVPACNQCNAGKCDKPLLLWMYYRTL
jgi:5-methylcytosine-specific restriction endonuclease McrA